MRLIDENGEMIGIMVPMRALDLAREKNLDLVEISPQAIPPVCKLMDYGRFKYEQAKRENEARKRQKVAEVKEIRLHPHTDEHDIDVRVRKIIQFVGEGDKVKVSVQFRGREAFHPELGRKLLEDILEQLKGIVNIERPPIMEGRNMWMLLARAPGWDPSKKAADAAATHHAAEAPTAMAQALAAAAPVTAATAPIETAVPSAPVAAPAVSSATPTEAPAAAPSTPAAAPAVSSATPTGAAPTPAPAQTQPASTPSA